MKSKVLTSSDRDLKNLKEYDYLYSVEFAHDGAENKDSIIIHKFQFKKYENPPEKNKIESVKNDSDDVYATIVDRKYPEVDIPHQNISYGYFFSIKEACEAMEEMLNSILKSIDDFKKTPKYLES